eukprot:6210611-Alexandrium_andersonii.AAC.1
MLCVWRLESPGALDGEPLGEPELIQQQDFRSQAACARGMSHGDAAVWSKSSSVAAKGAPLDSTGACL